MANTCTGFIEPLNWECLFVNMFVGNMEAFIFLSLIFIAGAAAYFRMTGPTLMIMIGLYAVILAQFATPIYFLVVLLASIITMVGIRRLFVSQ